ncbi:MAG: thiamine diphosphokinase [Eubacteriales bacterium]|nr:thiamine diphosphokinase [Eubacteriales bacterium]
MRALIILGGDAPPQELLAREAAQSKLVIAADLGAQYALDAGITPNLVLGDMDSLSDADLLKHLPESVQILHYPCEKDETDGQLAVDEAVARGAGEVCVLGGFGKRPDHALGNLMLLIRLEKRGISACMVDLHTWVRAARGTVEIAGQKGDTLSVLPFGSQVTLGKTKSLKYALEEMTPLPQDAPLGVSNVMLADRCSFCIEGGWAFVCRTF